MFTEHWPLLLKSKDAWGNCLVYEWKDNGKLAYIRSKGRNGIDDNGNGDDIQVKVDIRWLDQSKQ